MYAIETNNLTKKYGEKTVVNQVNLKVKKGSVFGFLGKNGAGKSTLINMLTGLAIPTSGTFKLNLNDSGSKKKVQAKVGVMPDYSSFYDDLSALEHLRYFSKILGVKMKKEEYIRLLEMVGLESDTKLKVKKFSFGMKKKLGIAQTLLNNPDIIFLDEPTSGVDANSVLTIHSLIKDISSDGTTVFLTSHNLDEVEKLCDEISIMDKGAIKLQGSIDSLKKEFQKNLTVTVKHGHIPAQHKDNLKHKLDSLASNVEWEEEYVRFVVAEEKKISSINRLFTGLDVDVYRIQVYEPSLEEIFLNTGKEETVPLRSHHAV
ncbi:ABC transporter ATP-binding protein [Terribacillus sp. 7520-G]|uniref:ABC transporter ATP-binding protein n=1 Tax=Terribacillus TaxID=459532 RepID=UPI000BA7AEE6|nr:ABC transporter ATP-binding protein [Terribacillus sp. 7520-G]PAD38922.1 ABC transporter ATP-binding protein [Terribacillus sp. 7520-G]